MRLRRSTVARECKWYRVCPMKTYYEQGRVDRYWVEHYCHGLNTTCVRYQMEERGEWHPDTMLPDGTIDESLRR